jgi:hypothetical protein
MWRQKNAVCVSCGAYKRGALERCRACGREPSSDYEMARALILSLDPGNRNTSVGRSANELQRIGKEISVGRPYLFDPAEEQTALRALEDVRDIERKKQRRNQLIRIGVIVLIFIVAYLLWPTGKR